MPLPAEPQPEIMDAAAQPFPELALKHFNLSLAARETLRLRRDLVLARARRENERQLAEQESQARQTLQSQKVVAQALQVGTLRLEGPSEATLRLDIYDSFESLERGTPNDGPHAKLFSVNLSGRRSEAVDRYSEFVSVGGPIEVTNYGYPADFTRDRNSNRFATGLGGTRPLIPGISAALSRALSSKLKARPGAVIEILDGRGRSYLVTYDDQSPQGNLNIDVYRPTFGSNNFCARVPAARVLRQGATGTCHENEGLPFSLQNYRTALLQLAEENRSNETEAINSPLEKTAADYRDNPLNDFELVEGSLPLARRLDSFADTLFTDTGFSTGQEVKGYLESGVLSLQEGIALVRKHGLNPKEFPPIRRMRANLEAAQQARQSIRLEEAKLRQAYQECEAEIFRIKVQASMEDDPIALAEVQRQIDDLQCSETAILAQLEEQGGRLHPASPVTSDQNRPTQVTSTVNLWKTIPDS